MVIEPADIEWRDGLPWSRRFGDIYFSRENGLAEKRHVFLEGNRLPERLAALPEGGSFTIAETGFGTGLNFLATWQLWESRRPAGAWLHFVSVERHPLRQEDLARALALWPELAGAAARLLAEWPFLTPGWHRLVFTDARITLTLLFGDALALLPDLAAPVDAWFLDGFAPDRNPELWQMELLEHVARLGTRGGTASTYSAAGAVRRTLTALGFRVARVKGFGSKREMLAAVREGDAAPPPVPDRRVLVIGAGIAGVSCARALARRGWRVELAERTGGPGSAASGNPAAIIYPKIAPPHLSAWHFQQQGYLWLLQQARRLEDAWRETGLLWLLTGNQAREGDKLEGHPWRPALVERLGAEEAGRVAGVPLAADCLHFPQAGFLHPDALYRHWLDHPDIRCRWHTDIVSLRREPDGWRARAADGGEMTAGTVILANALDARRFLPDLPVHAVRGQISLLPATPGLAPLRKVLSYGGYLTPAFGGMHCLGASFLPDDEDTGLRDEDHLHNRELLRQFVPALADRLPPPADWRGRAALRCQSRDYLPLVGPAPGEFPGLYLSIGHGSKGFCYAPLAAEILASRLNHEPCPVPERVRKSLDPGRFAARRARRNPEKRL